jgi:DNA gyrase/topoisomerase IV subunit A
MTTNDNPHADRGPSAEAPLWVRNAAGVDGRVILMSPEGRAEQFRHARRRLAVLRSVALGLDNARAVTDTLMAAENRAAALTALQELLGVDDTGALAIAELQWARLTKDTRPHIAQEIEELEAEIRALDD